MANYWILLVVISGGNGWSGFSAEFIDKTSCENAIKIVRETPAVFVRMAVCTPKAVPLR